MSKTNSLSKRFRLECPKGAKGVAIREDEGRVGHIIIDNCVEDDKDYKKYRNLVNLCKGKKRKCYFCKKPVSFYHFYDSNLTKRINLDLLTIIKIWMNWNLKKKITNIPTNIQYQILCCSCFDKIFDDNNAGSELI